MSLLSPNAQLVLANTGEYLGTWGDKVGNTNFGIMDRNRGGRLTLAVTGATNVVLTSAQAQNVHHTLTGALTGNILYTFPNAGGFYFINNLTTGAFSVSAAILGGGSLTLPDGGLSFIFLNPDNGSVELIATTSVGASARLTRIATASLPYPVQPTDGCVVVDATAGGGNVDVPLAAIFPFREITVKKSAADVSVNTALVVPTGSDTIDGDINYALSISGDAITIKSDGVSDWVII